MAKANNAADRREISLPSFRDGVKFTVLELTFGDMKAIARNGGATPGDDLASQLDSMDAMLTVIMRKTFPDVTSEEIDGITQSDVATLSNAIAPDDKVPEVGFTAPANTAK